MEKTDNFQQSLKNSHVALVGLAGQKIESVMKKCDVSEMTVYNWINGKNVRPIKPRHKKILMKIYGIQEPEKPILEEIKKG